jgi:hypothetical protein
MNKPIPTESIAPVETPRRRPFPELDFPTLLERMTPVERLRAYRSGTFDRRERTIWAARFPEEVPLVNGELEWIARSMADLD